MEEAGEGGGRLAMLAELGPAFPWERPHTVWTLGALLYLRISSHV